MSSGYARNLGDYGFQHFDPEALRRVEELIGNALTARTEFLRKFTDPRRNVEDECGHPRRTGTAQEYHDLYSTDAIAARVVQVFPKESWQAQPCVYEDEDPENETPFEEAWQELGRGLEGARSFYKEKEGSPIWEYLQRADILSGIGQFGIILLGLDDGLPYNEPVRGSLEDATGLPGMESLGTDAQYYNPLTIRTGGNGSLVPQKRGPGRPRKTPRRRLVFLRTFPESLVEITRFEDRTDSPRCGCPVMYRVTLNDPRDRSSGIGLQLATMEVHWTRIIHVADNLNSSEVFGTPRMQPVLPRLLDLKKLYGGSAEMYWRGAFPGVSFETHPTLGGDVQIDTAAMRTMVENYMNGLQRYLSLIGMTAKSLAPQVVDPSPQIERQIEAICINLGIPKRVFMGSERGELASTQDDSAWNSRLRQRQVGYLTPRLVVPFIDRLIALGVLPEPDEGYCVQWPDLDSQTKAEKANTAFKLTQAVAAYVGGSGHGLIPPREYLTRVFGWSEDEAEVAVTKAEAIVKQKQQEAMDHQRTLIDEGLAPDPTLKPAVPGKSPTGKGKATAMGIPGLPQKAGSGYPAKP